MDSNVFVRGNSVHMQYYILADIVIIKLIQFNRDETTTWLIIYNKKAMQIVSNSLQQLIEPLSSDRRYFFDSNK